MFKRSRLTPREQQVLEFLTQGKSNTVIAKHLSLEVGSVEKHLTSIYKKLRVQSRTEAVVKYYKQKSNDKK